MTLRAAIFDLGGVVLDSPMAAIRRFEEEQGIPVGTVNGIVQRNGGEGAWAMHERGEIDRRGFADLFADELSGQGLRADTAALLEEVEAATRVRPRVLAAVDGLRAKGVAVAAITNNWEPASEGLRSHFDVFVESVREGVRKPEPRIYRICLERLGLPASACAMFDDLGPNLKPAREMGMVTVKVTGVDQLLGEIRRIFP